MIEKIVEYNDADNVKTLLKFTATVSNHLFFLSFGSAYIIVKMDV